MTIFIGNSGAYIDSSIHSATKRKLEFAALLAKTITAKDFFLYQAQTMKEAFALAQKELVSLFAQNGLPFKLSGFLDAARKEKKVCETLGIKISDVALHLSQVGTSKDFRFKTATASLGFWAGSSGLKLYTCRGTMPQFKTMIETVQQSEKENPKKFRRAFRPMALIDTFSF